MLSNADLRKKIKNGNILIYPFIDTNVENANICVTASKYAWSIERKNSKHKYLFHAKGEGGGENKDKDDEGRDKDKEQIRIPSKQCALVFTEEVVFVGEKLAGECIPRVDLSIDGLAYNGAPMKPGRAEILKITIFNQTDDDMYIDVGKRIAVLMFHELSSKDRKIIKAEADHNEKIYEFLFKCERDDIAIELLRRQKEFEDRKNITDKLKEDKNYIKFKKSNETLKDKIDRNKVLIIFGLLLILLIVLMVVLRDKTTYSTVLNILTPVFGALFGGLLLKKFRWE